MIINSPLDTIATLMATDIAVLSSHEALQAASVLIDLGGDIANRTALDRAAGVLDELQARGGLAADIDCRIHYCRANVWSAIRRIAGETQSWIWKSDFIESELLELRRTVSHPVFHELAPVARAQAFTNLGNLLNHIGRFVEAIEAWDRALVCIPNLGMANGNRGLGLIYYAGALYDPGHRGVLVLAARHALERAGADDVLWESPGLEPARAQFAQRAADIDSHFDVPHISASTDLNSHSLGRSRREREYRRWCLANRLFLNPLNDIGPYAIAANDIMTLPSLTVGFEDGPGLPPVIRYFNLLKQEYASARYALYDGLTTEGVHFSDRNVLIYNTLDFPAFGHGVERLKAAFRSAYSLLDKIGFLLNAYLGLGHGERQVTFRNLWFESPKARALHPKLEGAANWPLRGLFWLAKDVYEDAFRKVTEPDGQALYELRNHLEHKFVGVHDDLVVTALYPPAPAPGVFDISASDLAARTLRQMKLTRAALTYLTMGVFAEERRREAERGGSTIPMSLFTWKDAWKRRN